jgi:hypothetical protein
VVDCPNVLGQTQPETQLTPSVLCEVLDELYSGTERTEGLSSERLLAAAEAMHYVLDLAWYRGCGTAKGEHGQLAERRVLQLAQNALERLDAAQDGRGASGRRTEARAELLTVLGGRLSRESALASAQRLCEIAPDNGVSWMLRADVAWQRGQMLAAANDVQRAAECREVSLYSIGSRKRIVDALRQFTAVEDPYRLACECGGMTRAEIGLIMRHGAMLHSLPLLQKAFVSMSPRPAQLYARRYLSKLSMEWPPGSGEGVLTARLHQLILRPELDSSQALATEESTAAPGFREALQREQNMLRHLMEYYREEHRQVGAAVRNRDAHTLRALVDEPERWRAQLRHECKPMVPWKDAWTHHWGEFPRVPHEGSRARQPSEPQVLPDAPPPP